MNNAERQREFRKRHTATVKDQVYAKLGNKCSNPACQWLNADGTRGCTDRRCLQIDHVKGGGIAERRQWGGLYFLKLVLADLTGKYQLLCANCNWIKRNSEYERKILL